jgi:hypothetical protein
MVDRSPGFYATQAIMMLNVQVCYLPCIFLLVVISSPFSKPGFFFAHCRSGLRGPEKTDGTARRRGCQGWFRDNSMHGCTDAQLAG